MIHTYEACFQGRAHARTQSRRYNTNNEHVNKIQMSIPLLSLTHDALVLSSQEADLVAGLSP